MKYYKWVPSRNNIIILRKQDDKMYEPYFNKELGFTHDFYDDYITDFLSDKKLRPETVKEISEKEALTIIKSQDY